MDVIISKFSQWCFRMAEGFENLDKIIRDYAKDAIQKSFVQALNLYEKQDEERKKAVSFLENDSEKMLEQS